MRHSLFIILFIFSKLIYSQETYYNMSDSNSIGIFYSASLSPRLVHLKGDGINAFYMHQTDSSLSYLILHTYDSGYGRLIEFNPDIVYVGEYKTTDSSILFYPRYKYYSKDSVEKQFDSTYYEFFEYECGKLMYEKRTAEFDVETIYYERVNSRKTTLPRIKLYLADIHSYEVGYVHHFPEAVDCIMLIEMEQKFYDTGHEHFSPDGFGSYKISGDTLYFTDRFLISWSIINQYRNAIGGPRFTDCFSSSALLEYCSISIHGDTVDRSVTRYYPPDYPPNSGNKANFISYEIPHIHKYYGLENDTSKQTYTFTDILPRQKSKGELDYKAKYIIKGDILETIDRSLEEPYTYKLVKSENTKLCK